MALGRDIKVGVFVVAGLVLSGLVIFLIGDERRLFASSVEFHTKFSDVQGLKGGAPIRMGGIDIGHVDSVGYGKVESDTTVYVTLDIVKAEASRIKTDSLAKIITKGLLGDKMVEITKGVAPTSVPPGGEITAEEPKDMMDKVTSMSDKAEATLANLERASQTIGDEKLQREVRESVSSLNVVLGNAAHGDGYLTKFMTDKAEADRISRTLDNIDHATAELTTTLRAARAVTQRVEQGPGFAHDVIYGDGPQKQIEQFGAAAGEVATTLKGIRESDSLVHDMVYGGKGEGAEAIANLTAITADVRTIVANMKAGKGTVGALLVDPSIYEDMKSVLGNVQRNDVLRALVRYSIKQDEKKSPVQVSGGQTP